MLHFYPKSPVSSLTLGGRHVPGMMDLEMLVVVRLGRRCLAADGALEGSLVRVRPCVLLQIVRPVEALVTLGARELLLRLMLPRVAYL